MILTGNYKHQASNHRSEGDEVSYHCMTEGLKHYQANIHGNDPKMMTMVNNGQD